MNNAGKTFNCKCNWNLVLCVFFFSTRIFQRCLSAQCLVLCSNWFISSCACESQHLSDYFQRPVSIPESPADWQGMQASISPPFRTSLQHILSLMLTQHGNSSTETCSLSCTDSSFLVCNFLTLYVRCSHHPFHPWYIESCGEAFALKQLAFSSWKANPTKGNFSSFHKTHNKCVSTHRRARKQYLSNLKNELSNLPPSSKSWWHFVKSEYALE